ncbi:hypothetical protein QBC34DRAFT_30919 [Podospora aff. communis PSN243]|uniref:Uncharacterized protein n=1 Tax=Podospora aff. communis PSN243 TaxID=3040156 RepID=A0AAV9G4N1_9PEZI|nr:hypothetical protein QBC34DRAFT_30919 [Podospora aff. communis PSN243]
MRRGGGARQEGTSFNLGPAGNRQCQPPLPTSEGASWALSGWMSRAPVSRRSSRYAPFGQLANVCRRPHPGIPDPHVPGPPLRRLWQAPPVRDHWCRKPGSTTGLEWINSTFPRLSQRLQVLPPPRNDPPRSSWCESAAAAAAGRCKCPVSGSSRGHLELSPNPKSTQLARTFIGPTMCVMGRRGVPGNVRSAASPLRPACSRRDDTRVTRSSNGYPAT